ncbi:hypothetical protein PISMIDRAFT_670645, partial [Pisolithus microcarpus 441]
MHFGRRGNRGESREGNPKWPTDATPVLTTSNSMPPAPQQPLPPDGDITYRLRFASSALRRWLIHLSYEGSLIRQGVDSTGVGHTSGL